MHLADHKHHRRLEDDIRAGARMTLVRMREALKKLLAAAPPQTVNPPPPATAPRAAVAGKAHELAADEAERGAMRDELAAPALVVPVRHIQIVVEVRERNQQRKPQLLPQRLLRQYLYCCTILRTSAASKSSPFVLLCPLALVQQVN